MTVDDIYRMEREGNKEEIEKFQKLANFQSTQLQNPEDEDMDDESSKIDE